MQSQGLEGLVLNMETCSPQLVQSLGAFNVPCTLYFSAGVEIERQIGTCIARHAMIPARLSHIFVLQRVVLTTVVVASAVKPSKSLLGLATLIFLALPLLCCGLYVGIVINVS